MRPGKMFGDLALSARSFTSAFAADGSRPGDRRIRPSAQLARAALVMRGLLRTLSRALCSDAENWAPGMPLNR